MKTLLFSILIIFSFPFYSHCQTPNIQWHQTNGPYGGNIQTLATDGTNLYAGSIYGGVFLSSNNGSNWLNIGLTDHVIKSIALNGNNIILGSNDGIYLSNNKGNSWAKKNNGLTNPTIESLIINGSNIFAGTYGSGVFLSSDDGNSWTEVNNGLTSGNIFSLCNIGGNIFAGTDSGIYKSTNNGSSWLKVNNGLTNLYIRSISASGTNLFAGTWGDGVFLSIDNGANWVKKSLSNQYVLSLLVSGANIYAGTWSGMFLSTNNGNSWALANNGLKNYEVISISIIGTNVFVGTSGGVYLSTNNGGNWIEKNNGLRATRITSFGINENNLFVGTWGNGVFLSKDNGNSWSNVGLSNSYLTSIVINGNKVFAATQGDGVFLSTNNGSSWIPVNNSLLNKNVNSLCINGSNIFAATDTGVFVSIDNGDSWVVKNNGLTNKNIFSIATIGSNIILGSNDGIYLSNNKGNSWTQKNNGLSQYPFIKSLSVSANNIFAIDNGVYLSSNNANSWKYLGLNNLAIQAIAVNGGNIFAASWYGDIYLSSDNGVTWTIVNNGLGSPYPLINSLAISGSNIFVGTDGQGVWVSSLPWITDYPKLYLSESAIIAGTNLSIAGSDFKSNGKAKVNISGPGGFLQSKSVTTNNIGNFIYNFISTTSMLPGIYTMQATDSITGFSAPAKSFNLINPSAFKPTIKVIYPTQNLTFNTNDSITVEWQDKLLLNNTYPLVGSKRKYQYTVAYSINGGSYQTIGTVQGEDYINKIITKNKKFKLSSPSNNIVVRVTDAYLTQNYDISGQFSVTSSSASNIQVQLKWDYSFPTPTVPIQGVAADGVARIYLELSKINQTGANISSVSLSLNDGGVNTGSAKLGKVIMASSATSYSSEANNITTTTASDNTSGKAKYLFWYVAPDDFAGNNSSDESSSFRFVNAQFTVNYVGGAQEIFTKKIKIVRPPLMLVHGLAGDPSSWDNFKTSSYGKLINDYRFLTKRPIKMNPSASFINNAYAICPRNPSPSSYYNTFQGVISDLRNQGYAANQVDYIGHSMGGCVLRSVLDNYYSLFTCTGSGATSIYKNYESGYIHKVITIGTPHNSSPWADILNRYIGDLPLSVRFLFMEWYGAYQNSLPFSFIQPEDPGAFIWKYTVTDAVRNLQLSQANGGIDFNTANVKAHLIAGDFFPGTQASLANAIPQDAISFVKNVGNDMIEKVFNEVLKVAAIKEPDPVLKQKFQDLLVESIPPLDKALKFLDIASVAMDAANTVTFLPESDLVVHVSSQLADNPKSASNVTVFDDWVAHAFVRPELKNLDIADRVDELLNSPINSSLFGKINKTRGKNEPNLPPSNQSEILSLNDTNKIKILSPDNGTNFKVDTTMILTIDVKDTVGLRSLDIYFQDKSYNVPEFTLGVNNISIQVNTSLLDSQNITVQAFYNYSSDSGLFVYDEKEVFVNTTSVLQGFHADPDIVYLMKGEKEGIQHYGIYQNFITAVNNFSSNISVTINDPSIVEFDKNTKQYKGVEEGETFAIVSYKGFSDTVYFVVFEMPVDTTTNEVETLLSEKNTQNLFSLIPNPNSGTFAIQFMNPTENNSIEIFNSIGQKVFNQPLIERKKTLQISLGDLPEGIYFIQVVTTEGIQTKKFVIAK